MLFVLPVVQVDIFHTYNIKNLLLKGGSNEIYKEILL